VITSAPRRRRPRPAKAALAVLATAFLVLAGGAVSPAAAEDGGSRIVEMTPDLRARIQRMMESYQAENDIPGISVAVVTPSPHGSDPVITTFAAGDLVANTSAPVDASTQFELGSESKIFTADLLSYLVATGRVTLDDTVEQHAPSWATVPDWTASITLRDLATHQSGLPDWPPNYDSGCGGAPCENWRPGYTQAMLWDALDSVTLQWAPGTDWLYSDWGFALLGAILADVVQTTAQTQPPAYQPALDDAFLDALGMSSTMLEPATPDARLATPYPAGTGTTPTYLWDNVNAFAGGGGLISDATDMGTWVAAHLGYISPVAPVGVRSMADTLQPVSTITTVCSSPDPTVISSTDCGPGDFRMGLGWALFSAEDGHVGVPWAFKNGQTAGSSTDTALAPTLRTGVTTMYNRARTDDDAQLAAPILALLVANRTTVPADTPAHHEPEHREPRKAALAESGFTASGLLLPGLGAAALVAVGAALVVRRRTAGR